jgi:hypothetical protein
MFPGACVTSVPLVLVFPLTSHFLFFFGFLCPVFLLYSLPAFPSLLSVWYFFVALFMFPGAGLSTYIPFPFFLLFSLPGFPSLLSVW